MIAVVGGSGGVGASTFAAVIALLAGATLVDLDETGGGLDVLLGIERQPGARWSELRLDGGRLEPRALVDGLPRWLGTPVLALDSGAPHGLRAVLTAAAQTMPAVVDLSRASSAHRDEAVAAARLVVLVAQARVAALAAANRVLTGLGDAQIAVLLRDGDVPEDEAAALLGRPVVGRLPWAGRPVDLSAGRPPRALMAVALGVLDGLDAMGGRPR